MKFIEYDSKEWKTLRAEGWITSHVVAGIGKIRIACMVAPSPQEDIGRHVWKGDSITDGCKLCGKPYDNKWHA